MLTIVKENLRTGEREVIGTRPARSHKQVNRIREELVRLNQQAEPLTCYHVQ